MKNAFDRNLEEDCIWQEPGGNWRKIAFDRKLEEAG